MLNLSDKIEVLTREEENAIKGGHTITDIVIG